ncbi:MAG: hypothetical protein DRN06_06730 [Thermoprotei archaeon]|nr:MAG: hypothetical protein DRN06_06730 [Thermoprotei archaeon]
MRVELESARRKAERELMKLPFVHGIATTNDREAIVVFVESEEQAQMIPLEYAGFPVEVFVTGKIEALSLVAPLVKRTERFRPAPGGVSIGHYTITAGTLGSRVYDSRTGARLILSNNHVLAATNRGEPGDPILQPGPYDGGTMKDMIARLLRFVRLLPPPTYNRVDCAVAMPIMNAYLSDEILGIGVVNEENFNPEVGMTVFKSGRTTGVTSGKITYTNATVKVWYGGGRYYIFGDQIVTTFMARGGDSGSLLVDEDHRAVGLLFAGSSRVTVHNRIEYVCRELGVTFSRMKVRPPKIKKEYLIAAGAFIASTALTYYIARRWLR